MPRQPSKSIAIDKKQGEGFCLLPVFGRGDRSRARLDLFPKKFGVPVSACFRVFWPLSARKHILSGTLTSTVSVCSVRGCGINCGQAKHPECSSRRIRGVFCRLYGNSYSAKSQGLSQNKFCPAVNKEKGIFRSLLPPYKRIEK